jgi:hypothetical protein
MQEGLMVTVFTIVAGVLVLQLLKIVRIEVQKKRSKNARRQFRRELESEDLRDFSDYWMSCVYCPLREESQCRLLPLGLAVILFGADSWWVWVVVVAQAIVFAVLHWEEGSPLGKTLLAHLPLGLGAGVIFIEIVKLLGEGMFAILAGYISVVAMHALTNAMAVFYVRRERRKLAR